MEMTISWIIVIIVSGGGPVSAFPSYFSSGKCSVVTVSPRPSQQALSMREVVFPRILVLRHPLCAPPTKTHHCHWWTQKCPRREWILEASDPWIKKEVPGNWAPGHHSEFSSLRCTFRAQPPDFRDALQSVLRNGGWCLLVSRHHGPVCESSWTRPLEVEEGTWEGLCSAGRVVCT